MNTHPILRVPEELSDLSLVRGLRMRIKIVHGLRAGRLLVGVLAPVLSVAGDVTPSSVLASPLAPAPAADTSGVAFPDLLGGGLLRSISARAFCGDDSPPSLPVVAAASRSARSCCLRSFLRSFFARSRSALSNAA